MRVVRLLISPGFSLLLLALLLVATFLTVAVQNEKILLKDASHLLLLIFSLSLILCTAHRILLFLQSKKEKVQIAGSVLFHLSLLFIMGGGALTGKSFSSSSFVVTEGQTLLPRGEEFHLTLSKFTPEFKKEVGIRYTSDISCFSEKGRKDFQVQVNQPAELPQSRLFLLRYGFSPELTLRDAEGKILFSSFVNLKIHQEEEEDSFSLPGTPLQIAARIYPDAFFSRGQLHSRSLLPRNPLLYLTIRDKKRVIESGYIPIGKSLAFLHGRNPTSQGKSRYSISFTRLRYWNQFLLTRERGSGFLFTGFLFAFVGLLLRGIPLATSRQDS